VGCGGIDKRPLSTATAFMGTHREADGEPADEAGGDGGADGGADAGGDAGRDAGGEAGVGGAFLYFILNFISII
jgi:hypothetical protein